MNKNHNIKNDYENHDLILYPDQCKFILRVSLLSAISCSYALSRQHYDLALVPGGVLLTSLNYWRLPTYGWRRNLDMIYVACSFMYQNIRAYYMVNAVIYYYVSEICILFYPASIYLYKKKCYWASTYAHCMLHITANIACIILHAGSFDIHPPSGSVASFCPRSNSAFFR